MNYDSNLSALYIQEQDRKRIARDLHDISLQNLAHLTHKIELAAMTMDKDPVGAKLELYVINKKLREIMEDIRNIIFDLRPMTFDDLGLKASLERLLEMINEEGKYEIDADISDVSCEDNLILVNIFRIVQEFLNNIIKHANADKIVFRCRQEEKICFISISDNGIGFDTENIDSDIEKHFGISLIKDCIELLGGKLSIVSKIGEGSNITMEIPLGD